MHNLARKYPKIISSEVFLPYTRATDRVCGLLSLHDTLTHQSGTLILPYNEIAQVIHRPFLSMANGLSCDSDTKHCMTPTTLRKSPENFRGDKIMLVLEPGVDA